MGHIGEIAAIGTSALWTACSILFASASRRIGPLSVNAYRIVVAALLLSFTHRTTFGTFLPQANPSQWFYLGLSGAIGLAIGDFGYFGMLALIGPRRALLITSLSPIFSSISAYFILNEKLNPLDIIGISVTLVGVATVVLEKEKDGKGSIAPKQKTYGYLCGLGGALGQGIGLVISKYGMTLAGGKGNPPLDPLPTALIRMIVATCVVWSTVVALGKLPSVLEKRRDSGAITRTSLGAITGPFLGVWLSMVAVSKAPAGIAATLMSLMPVMVIPTVRLLYGEKTSTRGLLGAATAVVGVTILLAI